MMEIEGVASAKTKPLRSKYQLMHEQNHTAEPPRTWIKLIKRRDKHLKKIKPYSGKTLT